MIAQILGVPFLGFALTIAIGSPLLDYIGMGLLLPLSGVCFTVGTLIMLFARAASRPAAASTPCSGPARSCMGIGWGLVETVINPLIAALYPEDKTTKLNLLHAWWPGGLVIGGLLGVAMSAVGLGWQAKLALALIPAVAVIVLSIGVRFRRPSAPRPASSMGEMFRELLNPLFIVLFLSMFLTAASELAPGQWVDFALSRTVHMPGILLLVYVSGLMFVMRHFAGPLVHKLSPIGLLWVSCLLAALGLVALSYRELARDGHARRDALGHRRLLHVADDAGDRVGAVSAGRRAADGADGDGRHAVDPVRAAAHGRDLRQQEDRGRRRRGRVQRACSRGEELERVLGIAAQTSFRVRRHPAGDPADRVRRDLALRPVARAASSRRPI